MPKSLKKFSQRFLKNRTKAKKKTPQHPLFKAINQLLAKPLSIRNLVITRALAKIRKTVARKKRRRSKLSFNNMLSRLNSALRSKSSKVLAAAIRTQFPVAIINKFQNTNPQQYQIFRRI